MPTNILQNDHLTESIAQFLSSGDRGIVETADGRVFSYDSGRRKGHRFVEEKMGFHPGMWLQPALSAQVGNPVRFMPAGEYPFKELETHLEFMSRVSNALKYFLMSLDSDFEVENREHFARKATHMLKEDAVRALVEPVLMNNPLPEGFDTAHGPKEGKAGEIMQAMIAKWRAESVRKPLWSKNDFDLLKSYDAAAFAIWLHAGIIHWEDAVTVGAAFAPVQTHFCQAQPIAMQLVEMAKCMEPHMRTLLVEGARLYRNDCIARERPDEAEYADNLHFMLDVIGQ